MYILETIVTTRNSDGTTHIAPLGVWSDDSQHPILAPFRPSRTLDNLMDSKIAIINCTDDVRVFAGCIVGRRNWSMCPANSLPISRLADCLSHRELEVVSVEDDELRPRFHCKLVSEHINAPFMGFNRAQAAVIELAILVSRLDMLETSKVERELEYLKIAIEKTASDREHEAWQWLIDKIQQHPTHKHIKSL